MPAESPKRTAAFDEILAVSRSVARSLILRRVLARVTGTTETYWEEIWDRLEGPRPVLFLDAWWYEPAEVAAWLAFLEDQEVEGKDND